MAEWRKLAGRVPHVMLSACCWYGNVLTYGVGNSVLVSAMVRRVGLRRSRLHPVPQGLIREPKKLDDMASNCRDNLHIKLAARAHVRYSEVQFRIAGLAPDGEIVRR